MKIELIAEKSNAEIQLHLLDTTGKPALITKEILLEIANSAESMGLTYKYMPSGAGHDAQEMALIAPAGLIFVPGVSCISHAPKEFTMASDMANGANVLMESILALDKKLQ